MRNMRKTLLATVAAAATVGFITLAAAQAPEGDKGAARPQGAEQQPKAAPGGAGMHQQGGAPPAQKALGPQGGQSAQDRGKAQERMGQTSGKRRKRRRTAEQSHAAARGAGRNWQIRRECR